MEQMKHQNGFAPSAEETAKLNEIVSWLVDNGYSGIMLIHKGDVGVSWAKIKNDESVRHLLINSISHIASDDGDAAVELARGIILAAKQLTE